MPQVELPKGLSGSENLPKTKRGLLNCFNNGQGRVLSRPGIDELNTTGRVARGEFEFNNKLYQVASQDLIEITDTVTGAFDVIGTIEGPQPIQWAVGFVDAVIVVPGGKTYAVGKPETKFTIDSVSDSAGVARFNYTPAFIGDILPIPSKVIISGFTVNPSYNGTFIITNSGATFFEVASVAFVADEATGVFGKILQEISQNANFVPFVDVTFIAGRFVYIPADGSPFRWSDVGKSGSIQPESFADAEQLPDLNNGSFEFLGTLYITGTDSIQPFSPTTSDATPFLPIGRAAIPVGFIGGMLEYNNTFLFVGRYKDQAPGIYSLGKGQAPKISNEFIDTILATYTDPQLAEALPGRIIWRGYDLAFFTFRDDSFGFFGGEWFGLDTVVNGISRPWSGGYIAEFNGEYFSAFDNKIGKFEKINLDYGERITKIINGAFEKPDSQYFDAESMTLGLSQGFNQAPGSVALSVSDSNVQFGPRIYRNTSAIGRYSDIVSWETAGGLGMYEGFMAYEIYTAEDIDFAVDSLSMEFG